MPLLTRYKTLKISWAISFSMGCGGGGGALMQGVWVRILL